MQEQLNVGRLESSFDQGQRVGQMSRDERHHLPANATEQWIFPSVCSLPSAPVRSRFDLCRWWEQLISEFAVRSLHPTGQQPIVSDHVEIVRRNVTNQLPEELDGLQGVKALATAIQIIFELEGNHGTGVTFDPEF